VAWEQQSAYQPLGTSAMNSFKALENVTMQHSNLTGTTPLPPVLPVMAAAVVGKGSLKRKYQPSSPTNTYTNKTPLPSMSSKDSTTYPAKRFRPSSPT